MCCRGEPTACFPVGVEDLRQTLRDVFIGYGTPIACYSIVGKVGRFMPRYANVAIDVIVDRM